MERDYLRALPPLRFFGALFLVLFHLHYYGFMAVQQPQLVHLISKGYIGTSLFFVVSGFVLMHVHFHKAHLRPSTFYWSRLTRLLPPYYLGLLLGFPIVLFGGSATPVVPAELVGQLSLYLSALQAWVYGQAFLFDGPGWSITVLVFFYLLFPFLRSRLLRMSTRAVAGTFLSLWLVYLVPPVVFMLTSAGPHIDDGSTPLNFLKTFPLFRLPELVLGMLAAVVYHRGTFHQLVSWRWLPLLSFGLLVGVMLLVPEPNTLYPLFHNGLLSPLIVLCVLSLAAHQGGLARLGEQKWMQMLGNTSLNMFLLHVPLFSYYRRLLPGAPEQWTVVEVLGYLLVLIGSSVVLELYVTAPLMRRLRRPKMTTQAAPVSRLPS